MSQNEKFGVREIVNVTFKARSTMQIGNTIFKKGEPVFYFDSAKTSTLESTSATVYAQGGRGNARLLAWEGDKVVTFRFEEALLSTASFALLSGGNLTENTRVQMHQAERVEVTFAEVDNGTAQGTAIPVLDLTPFLPENGQILSAADSTQVNDQGSPMYPNAAVYVMELNESGEITRRFEVKTEIPTASPSTQTVGTIAKSEKASDSDMKVTKEFLLVGGHIEETNIVPNTGEAALDETKIYLVDYYVSQPGSSLTITPGKFAGAFLIEANTLFRRQSDSRDLPAQFTIPNGKISSNFTFTMASTGDPSTFPFEVEAFPDYLPFQRKCKAMFALDVAEEPVSAGDC